ncbi:MAG: methyl-accepting chemotaxis protein [Deltaproteobacteria bacterium]|nr:methyl-accepting chemotaxis protein [Deltaproteobacteria bacterium]
MTVSGLVAVPSAGGIVLYLVALFDFAPAELANFLATVALLLPIFLAGVALTHHELTRPAQRWLAAERAGSADTSVRQAAFQCLARLPQHWFLAGGPWWATGGLAVALLVHWYTPDQPMFHAVVIFAAAVSGGFLMQVAHFYVTKRWLQPFVQAAGRQLTDRAVLGAGWRRVSIAVKLVVSTTGVGIVVIAFAVLLLEEAAGREVGAAVARVQRASLAELSLSPSDSIAESLSALRERGVRLGLYTELVLLDRSGDRVIIGPSDYLTAAERAVVKSGLDPAAHRVSLHAPHVLAWRRLPGNGEILVAALDTSQLPMAAPVSQPMWALAFAIILVSGALLSLLFAGDTRRAINALKREAALIAHGDLRYRPSPPAEDELGDLALAVEHMRVHLAQMVGNTTQAAVSVREQAGRVDHIAAAVAETVAKEIEEVRDATDVIVKLASDAERITSSCEILKISVAASATTAGTVQDSAARMQVIAGVVDEKIEALSRTLAEGGRAFEEIVAPTANLIKTNDALLDAVSGLRQVGKIATATSAEQTSAAGSLQTALSLFRDHTQRVHDSLEAQAAAVAKVRDTLARVSMQAHDDTARSEALRVASAVLVRESRRLAESVARLSTS